MSILGKRKILQIIPASGVDAKFQDKESKEFTTYTVVCWALTEEVWGQEDGEENLDNIVVGMIFLQKDSELSFVDCQEGPEKFIEYEYQ